MQLRKSRDEDFPAITSFYQERLPGYSVAHADLFFIAVEADQVRGAVRLTEEQGLLLLRGMQVAPSYQGDGLGTALLHLLGEEIGGREAFCIPYSHLENFYGRIGFRKIQLELAPAILRERLEKYLKESVSIIMHRSCP